MRGPEISVVFIDEHIVLHKHRLKIVATSSTDFFFICRTCYQNFHSPKTIVHLFMDGLKPKLPSRYYLFEDDHLYMYRLLNKIEKRYI